MEDITTTKGGEVFEYQDFPREIKRLLLIKLALPEVLTARLVCKEWWSIFEYDCNSFWREFVFTRFRIPNLQASLNESSASPLIEEKKKEIIGIDGNWRERFTSYCRLKPLIHAIKDNDDVLARKIVSSGLNVNLFYCDSFTPLHHAINVKNTAMSLYLLDHGFSNINSTDIRGETPLHRAAWNDQLEVAKKLLALGAELEAKNFFGYTPLHLAAANGRLELVKYLISVGSQVNAKSNVGNTPLHRAKCRGHPKVVKYLMEQGADSNIRNDHGRLATDYAKIVRKNHKLDFT